MCVEEGWGRSSQQKTCNISETGEDRTKFTADDQQEVAYALSTGALPIKSTTLDDLEGALCTVSKHMRLSDPQRKFE